MRLVSFEFGEHDASATLTGLSVFKIMWSLTRR